MAQNLWQAGAVDNIYAPYEWSNGGPQAGDTLVIGAGAAFLPGGSVYGDTIVLSGQSSSSPAVLVAFGDSQASVLVSQEAYPSGAPGAGNSAFGIVEVVGAPQVSLEVLGGKQIDAEGTVNIAGYSQMQGGFTGVGDNAHVTINGTDPATSTFANTASSLTGYYDLANINADVVGAGTFDIGFLDSMDFAAGVSSGQAINDNGGSLTIGDAGNFHGSVNWSPTALNFNNFITLSGLTADHSSYANGVLSLTSGGSDVFDLRLQTTPGSDVVAAQASGGIQVFASAADAAAINAVPIAHA